MSSCFLLFSSEFIIEWYKSQDWRDKYFVCSANITSNLVVDTYLYWDTVALLQKHEW